MNKSQESYFEVETIAMHDSVTQCLKVIQMKLDETEHMVQTNSILNAHLLAYR